MDSDNVPQVDLPDDVVNMTQKEKLSIKEVELLVERVVLPFIYICTGIQLHPYQMEFAAGLSFSILSNEGWDITCIQARQCIAGDQIVLLKDGTACQMKDSPDSWVTGEDRQVYKLTCRSGFCIDQVTENHVFFTPEGEKELGDLKKGDKIAVCVGHEEWAGRKVKHGRVSTTRGNTTRRVLHKLKFTEELAEELAYATVHGREKGSRLHVINWDEGFPTDVFSATPEFAAAYLRKLFEMQNYLNLPSGDTRIDRNLYAGQNKVFARYCQTLLQKLGITSVLNEYVVPPSSVPYTVLDIAGRHNLDVLYSVLDGKELEEHRDMHPCEETHPDGEKIAWSVVDSIEPNGTAEVYDREVPGKGWFVCQGIKVHNSGKSEVVADVVFTLGMLAPQLAKLFKCERLARFREGLKIGIFGPSYEKAGIIHNRIHTRAESKHARMVYQDKSFGIDEKKIHKLSFPNGFEVDLRTAGKNANIEGHTYHAAVIDEAQDVDSYVIVKSIQPMMAWNNGNLIMIGTPSSQTGEFSEAFYRNKLLDDKAGRTNKKIRCCYEFNWRYVAKYNKSYLKHVEKMRSQYGENSDAFRQSYECEWIDSKGRFISADLIDRNGITEKDTLRAEVWRRDEVVRVKMNRASGPISHDLLTPDQVFAIDHGKQESETVLTVARVFWENPIAIGDSTRYHIHVQDWFEFEGDHEMQFDEIVTKIGYFKITNGISDATGPGDPINSRLRAVLAPKGVTVHPFVFNRQSKSNGYTLLQQELVAGRITWPAADYFKKYKKYQKFCKQMRELVKEFKGGATEYLSVHKPDGKMFRDDYPDSLMMLCWVVNMIGLQYLTVSHNPFLEHYRQDRRRQYQQYFDGHCVPKRRFGDY